MMVVLSRVCRASLQRRIKLVFAYLLCVPSLRDAELIYLPLHPALKGRAKSSRSDASIVTL